MLVSTIFSTSRNLFPEQENASGTSTSVLRTPPNSATENTFPTSFFAMLRIVSAKQIEVLRMRKNECDFLGAEMKVLYSLKYASNPAGESVSLQKKR